MSNADKIEKLRAKATQLHSGGQLDDAERLYARLLVLRRNDIQTRHMMGVLRLQQDRTEDALAILDAVLRDAPANPDIRTHRGLVLQAMGRHEAAFADFDQALVLRPDNPGTLLYRGNALLELGLFPQALETYDRLLTVVPQHAEAWFRRGSVLWHLDKAEEALSSYLTALGFQPGHTAALFNSATALLKLQRYDEAFAAFEQVQALVPDHRYGMGGAASALLGACDLAQWQKYQALVTDMVAHARGVIAPLVLLPFCDEGALRRACAAAFIRDRIPAAAGPLWTGQAYHHRRIRIAYLSADFHQHATAELIVGLIERHDRDQFEVSAFCFSRDDGSAMRARLVKAFDRFTRIRDLGDLEVAHLLWEGEYDIAIDLKGHTEGARPRILSFRPCPVQVNFLGYPGTVAAPWLDYVVGDAAVLPFDHQPFYEEKIVHLPHCYQPNDSSRVIAPDTPTRAQAGLPPTGFVFSCFNAAWKITPTLFDIWMRLLAAVPGSVLWLLEDNAAMPAHLRDAAAARGMDPARLVFAPPLEQAAHLARHRLADLFLDTQPYGAHTTATDALWTGLVIVTCLGAQFDGRVAASLLRAVGLPELVAASLAEYEILALALARDPVRLAALRARLAANRPSCVLYDSDGYRRHLEAAWRRMVEISRAGGQPQNFAIAP